MLPNILIAEEKKKNCTTTIAKLKPSCNFMGSSVDSLKKFSSKHKTIGQTLGIESGTKKIKTLKKFSKENKTIDQTIKNIKEKKKK